MIGRSFGLISAVYNYNRRSAMISNILIVIFEVPANFFYDVKFGFESMETIDTADEAAVFIHKILGCDFEDRKHTLSRKPAILVITYGLRRKSLDI